MSSRLVVIGAGAAGIACALEALERGAQVVLVERTGRAGGTLWVSGGLTSAARTRLQRAKGIEDDPALHYADVIRIGKGRAHSGVLRMVTDEAGGVLDWLEHLGVRFTEDSPIFAGFELYGIARSYAVIAPPEAGPWKGRVLAEALSDELERRRRRDPRIRVLLNSTATELELDKDGRIATCVVALANGMTERVPADSVVLATGGYGGNQRVLHRIHSGYDRLLSLAPAHARGDGIRLAAPFGATLVNADIVLPNPGGIEDPDHPGARIPGGMIAAGRPPALAGDIWVNRDGERFIAEDEPNQATRERSIAEQRDAVMVAVLDEPMRKGLTPEIAAWTASTLADPRLWVTAPTVGELADAAGLPADALERTILRYNESFGGADRLGRAARPAPIATPPYHAVPTRGTILMTFGGLSVDDLLQVLRADGSPIEGLFAAGETLGAGQLQGAGYASGMMIISAIVTGRGAARAALGA